MEVTLTKENNQNVLNINGIKVELTNQQIEQIITEYNKKVVGYLFEVNNKLYKEENWADNEIFENAHDIWQWLNIYGYGSGITTDDYIKIIKVTDTDASKYNYIKTSYNDEIVELCPHCGDEVVLKSIFANQVCPCCGNLISPCSLCDCNRCDCKNCPLQKILFTI